jgi:hypothetical protein
MAEQQQNFARMQESNFFFLSSLATQHRDGEAVQAERARHLTEALKETTMVSVLCFFLWVAPRINSARTLFSILV